MILADNMLKSSDYLNILRPVGAKVLKTFKKILSTKWISKISDKWDISDII